MPSSNTNESLIKNTSYKVVLPFYIYAALALLVACTLLAISSDVFTQHYFHPKTLAITHTMALGWATMMILGAGHQLMPVLIERRLFSNGLAYLSFIFAATGIPLLVYAFYTFNMNWPAQYGAIFINSAILCYLVNFAISLSKSKLENVHAVFAFTATLWLLLTTLVGLLLVYNFTLNILSEGSLHYLSLHAHMGIIGWLLLMVIGVGSRLLPMFLISKYNQPILLWYIYALINFGLLFFVINQIFLHQIVLYLVPVATILLALILFARYCLAAYRQRIRRQIDEQVKISLFSVLLMSVPLISFIIAIRELFNGKQDTKHVLLYGFSIFFGWITAIIFGMTFKTLPFIIWNKVYSFKAGMGKTPNPKELFSSKIFTAMVITYFAGFILFSAGIYLMEVIVLQLAALLLVATAILYNWNVFVLVFHKHRKE